MCSSEKLQHLTEKESMQVKSLSSEFKDLFSVSNEIIGRAKYSEFDINTENIQPISIPLRRVPLHKEEIVKEVIDHYKSLGLITKIDSPFQVPTVLVEKKNIGNSSSVTD